MSRQLPIYPPTCFTFPEQQHPLLEAPQLSTLPSTFFPQLPNVNTENLNNFVPPVAPTSLSNSRSLRSPNETQLPASIMLQVLQTTDASQLSQILDALPHYQAKLLLGQLQVQVHLNAQTPSTTTGPYPAALRLRQSASFPSNLSQSTTMPPTTNPHVASVAPSVPSRTEEASVPVIPSAKALGKRRRRSDSIAQEHPTKKQANGKAKLMPTKVAQSSSRSTASSHKNIPPPDGSRAVDPLVGTAVGQVPVPNGPQKKGPHPSHRSKAATSQPTEASGSGLSSMQTVFRATGTGFQPQNFSFPSGQTHYTLRNQQQQPPSDLPSGTVIAANEQPQFQTNGSQWTFQQPSQQPTSDHPFSSTVLAAPPIALEMDESVTPRMALAVEEIRKTGDLLSLCRHELMCYKPIQNILEAILVYAIRVRWVVRQPHPYHPLHFGPPSTAENVLDDENMLGRISSNVHPIATEGQLIHQTIGGEGSSTSGIQSVVDGNTYNSALQSDAYSNQIPHPDEAYHSQIPHPTQSNYVGPLDDSEHSVGQTFFESGTGVFEAQQAVINDQSRDEGPTSDVSAATQPQPTALPDNAYGLLDLVWDDILPQGMMANMPQMASSSHTVTPDSTDPLNQVGAESVFLDIDGSEGCHQAAATADQSCTTETSGIFSATGENTVLDVARSVGHSQPNPSDCGEVQGPTSNSDALESESPQPVFKDAVSFNQALYGSYESGSATLPFHLLDNYSDMMHTLTPMMGQQDGVFEEQAGDREFDMSQFVDFDPEN